MGCENKMAKKYKLHCFGCGWQFDSKKDVYRIMGNPYCEVCWAEYQTGIAEQQAHEWEMKRWQERHPNQNYEEWQIDQANIRKYGEY